MPIEKAFSFLNAYREHILLLSKPALTVVVKKHILRFPMPTAWYREHILPFLKPALPTLSSLLLHVLRLLCVAS